MNDDANGGNQRRRARQIDGEDDRTTIRRRHTNESRNDGAQADYDDDAPLPLSLSLGPTSYSSQIPPMTTTSPLRLAPPPPSSFAPPMTTWHSPDFTARLPSSHQPYFMTSPPPFMPPSSLYQTGSRGPSINFFPQQSAFAPPTRPVRPETSAVESRRSFRSQSRGDRKDDTIPPPFPWATNTRGKIQSMEYLESKQITSITGEVQCKHCEKVYQVSYNLREKFSEVENIFATRKRIMRERAPPIWTSPEAARCELCGRDKAVKPVIAERKHKINWLFLLLGQTLGYCTLEQLKNFCKHSKSHRTGAKDRVLYLTYLGLCKMLKPNAELFNRESFRR